MRTALFILALAAFPLAAAAATRTIADVRRSARPGDRVEISGTVTGIGGYFAFLHDGTSGIAVYDKVRYVFCATGDVLRVVGEVGQQHGDLYVMQHVCEKVGANPEAAKPAVLSPDELLHAKGQSYRSVILRGVVADAFRDECDPDWFYLLFSPLNAHAAAAVHDPTQSLQPATFLDADVQVYGNYERGNSNPRPLLRPYVRTFFTNDVQVLRPASSNPFSAAPPDDAADAAPTAHRQHFTGVVLATWGERSLFLKTDRGLRLRVHLAPSPREVPPPGSRVSIAGFPYHATFFTEYVNAVCRREADAAPDDETPVAVAPAELTTDSQNRRRLQYHMDGRLIRIRGTVIALSPHLKGRNRIHLLCGNEPVQAEASGLPLPPVNAEVEVTGICRFTNIEDGDNTGAMRLNGFSILPRTSADIRILRRPPWWTPALARLVVLALVALVFAGIVWILTLRKLVARKGRELARETLAHLKSEFRTDERTALAVELHDSIAQNLTGVSLQLEGVEEANRLGSPQLGALISRTRRALDACCAELRNCLWDLRNDAFDGDDVSATIRKAIAPHLGGTTADVAIDMPRSRVSDSTFHAILCIVRELVINAVRHGKARRIDVRGAIAERTLTLSVTDDGCGFSPESRPGLDAGHFGLAGVRERLDRIGGSLEIQSAPGHGTTVTITIEP